jgi:hypothetical protein
MRFEHCFSKLLIFQHAPLSVPIAMTLHAAHHQAEAEGYYPYGYPSVGASVYGYPQYVGGVANPALVGLVAPSPLGAASPVLYQDPLAAANLQQRLLLQQQNAAALAQVPFVCSQSRLERKSGS